MRVHILGLAILAALALSACSEKTDEAAAPMAERQATSADRQPPKRKAGLWEQTVTTEGAAMTSRVCTDEAFEQHASWTASQAMPGACVQASVMPASGGGWTFRSVCDMGSGGTTTTDGSAVGDFDSRYEIKATSTTIGAAAPQMNRTSQIGVVAEWKGACPAGWAAGDMELPGVGRISGAQMVRMQDMAETAK